MILLILDKIDIFCYEDRKALLDYQNDKSSVTGLYTVDNL
jgi:hypothetical protein